MSCLPPDPERMSTKKTEDGPVFRPLAPSAVPGLATTLVASSPLAARSGHGSLAWLTESFGTAAASPETICPLFIL